MISCLYYLTFINNDNFVSMTDRGDSVRYNDSSLVLTIFNKMIKNLLKYQQLKEHHLRLILEDCTKVPEL